MNCWPATYRYPNSSPQLKETILQEQTSNIIILQEKVLALEMLLSHSSVITGPSDHQAELCQCVGEQQISNFVFFNWKESYTILNISVFKNTN